MARRQWAGRGRPGRGRLGSETVAGRGEAGQLVRRWRTGARPAGARRAGWRDGGRPRRGRTGRRGRPGGERVAYREEGLSSSCVYGSGEQRGSGGGTNLLRDRACGSSSCGNLRGGGIVLQGRDKEREGVSPCQGVRPAARGAGGKQAARAACRQWGRERRRVQLAAREARGRRVRRGAEAAGGASSVTHEQCGRRERREVRAAPPPSGQRKAVAAPPLVPPQRLPF